MHKIKKICICAIILFILLTTNIFAISEILDTGKNWDKVGKEHTDTTMDTQNIATKAGEIYNLFLIVGTGVAFIVGAILGIKYMTAGFSEKADVKSSLFPYLISCVVLFGAMGIWKLILNILNSV